MTYLLAQLFKNIHFLDLSWAHKPCLHLILENWSKILFPNILNYESDFPKKRHFVLITGRFEREGREPLNPFNNRLLLLSLNENGIFNAKYLVNDSK